MLGRLVLVTLAAFAILALTAGAAFADIPSAARVAVEEEIAPHAPGGATVACSIVYYNLCRYTWVYVGPHAGDEIGVVFDLPADCHGRFCENSHFWWYWRGTTPGYGYTVSYTLQELDDLMCKQGAPVGTLLHMEPTERWNAYGGLGCCVYSDRVSIIASWDKGEFPFMTTDNNYQNQSDPWHCPDYVPHTAIRSVAWKYGPTTYCPPAHFSDAAGPVEILMDAGFYCLWEEDAARAESWSGVKKLFR